MDSRLLEAFNHWFTISSNLLVMVGLIFFIKLPKSQKTNIKFWFPFIILAFTVSYENLGAYTNYNFEFKKSVNAFLGNIEYPRFNLWLYNVTERQIGALLFLGLIRMWLAPSQKRYITWMMYAFLAVVLFLKLTGMELMYLHQPIIFALGANMILIGCGLYFIGIITQEQYLESNPLKLISFWLMTFIMFTFSLSYISSVTLLYLYFVNPVLGKFLQNIGNFMTLMNLGVLTLTIASPFLPIQFEKEPSYESN
ncbi:histidine kinase [Algoriphagus winogradskyi]|uniref:Uncharacterized protein n=1 Tax=Algoriphagus winogradskyi TaxID=237017 RepID=A0ABY1NQN4_9BACT|nr:histidine kinase [Algoriphagus winogradskyi]SMP14701.1 hypothetical protein SAMN06265367_102377 [Algoriphagus winogradskyi]